MDWRNDCALDYAFLEARNHEMTAKEFYSMPEK